MYTIKIFTVFVLVSLISTSNAQSLKDLKKLAKEKTKQSSSESPRSIPVNQDYIDFINEKYTIVYQSDDAMNIIDIERNGLDSEKHLEGAKKLNYREVLKQIDENGELDGHNNSKVNTLKNYQNQYKGIYDSRIKVWANNSIEQAYQQRGKDIGQAMMAAKNAHDLAKAASLILFDNDEVSNLLNEAKAVYDPIKEDYENVVFTSDFHRENAGKILFSNKHIKIGKEDPNQFKSEFSSNENIYAMVYLPRRIKDMTSSSFTNCTYQITLNGTSNHKISFTHNEEDLDNSYYLIEITPDPAEAVHALDPVEFAKILAPLSPRTHTLKLEFGTRYEPMFAEGEITLNWQGANESAITKNAETASEKAQENWARNTKLHEDFSIASEKFNDPSITNALIKKLFKLQKPECEEIIKIWVSDKKLSGSGDWYTFKNALDVPTNMVSTRYLKIIYKATDGWCYYTDYIKLNREYLGGGNYGDIEMYGFKTTKIDCNNVK
jgi:hypothetical protein